MNYKLVEARQILREHFAAHTNPHGSIMTPTMKREQKRCYDRADEFFDNLMEGLEDMFVQRFESDYE